MNPEILNRVKELVKAAYEATPELVFSKLAHLDGFLEGITDERAHVSAKRDFVESITAHAQKKQRQCSKCKEFGHISRTCPNAEAGAPETDEVGENEPWGDPLTEPEYRSVLGLKKDGLSSRETARNLDLNLREVNTAWGSADYEAYLAARG